jgi:deazaflavin-dependent oxidoreductase (nitroreductase family)
VRRLILVVLALKAAGWVIIALVVAGAAFLYRQQPASGPRAAHPAWRRFVTRRFNPVVLALGFAGGARSPWGVITHVGRRSGLTYETPILPHRAGDRFVIPLNYGREVHWLRNVVIAGKATIRLHGAVVHVADPRIVPAVEVLPQLPEGTRTTYRRLAIAEFLQVRVVPDASVA